MDIRRFKEEDIEKVSILSMETFERYNGDDYFDESAIQKVIDSWNFKKNKYFLENMKKTDIYFVAFESPNEMVGLIRGNLNRINSLFVKGEYHKKGIGQTLVQYFESEAIKQGSQEIELKASLFAIPFYQKMGYQKVSGVIRFDGLKVYPMKKTLKINAIK